LGGGYTHRPPAAARTGWLAVCGALRDNAISVNQNRSFIQLPRAQVADFCPRRAIGKLVVLDARSRAVALDKYRDWRLRDQIRQPAPGGSRWGMREQSREWVTA